MLALILGAAGLHEMGHLVVLRYTGAVIRELRIGVLGAVLETECSSLSYGAELAAVLAGPAVNLACTVGLLHWGGKRWCVAAGIHLALCFFNLLPIRPLDGGRAMQLLLAWGFGPGRGEQMISWTERAAAVLLLLFLAAVMVHSGGSLWLLPAACGLARTAWKGCTEKADYL